MYTITEISGLSQYCEQIFEIENLCFGTEGWSYNSLSNALSDDGYVFMVCFDGKKIVGYINASVVLDEAELNRVAVLEEYRTNGIGKLLVDGLIDILKAKKVSCIRLEVRQSNIPAISLYTSRNFEKYAIRKQYYDNPVEDAVLMLLTI